MSLRFNKKYGGSGSIFQGSYKSRSVQTDEDLHNVALYVMAKNVMERYRGGVERASTNFEDAWNWACNDQFSSFPEYGASRDSPIVDRDVLMTHFESSSFFKREVKEYIKNLSANSEALGEIALE